MNNSKTYKIYGLTCKNCVAKVQQTLAPFASLIEVSADLSRITLENQQLDVESMNAMLKEKGGYKIGAALTNAPIDALQPDSKRSLWLTYKPLILVLAYILLVTLVVEYVNGRFLLHRFMPNFMAGFFLVFSFFKLLDLKGFASSYSMYDIAAKKIPAYGLIYPFIELALGAAYLMNFRPMLINAVTLVVMVFSSIGVILAVMNKQKIKCACLGTGFNLPMTTVTIIEDLLMAGMAAWMLI